MPHQSGTPILYEVDALARVTYAWVRQQLMEQRFGGCVLPDEEERALAAGFLAGIRSLGALPDHESVFVAYAYLLMRGERDHAAALAAALVHGDSATRTALAGYRHGKAAASGLLGEAAAASPSED